MSVVCMCEVKATEPMWRSEDGPRDETQAVKLDGSHLYPLNHLTAPKGTFDTTSRVFLNSPGGETLGMTWLSPEALGVTVSSHFKKSQ